MNFSPSRYISENHNFSRKPNFSQTPNYKQLRNYPSDSSIDQNVINLPDQALPIFFPINLENKEREKKSSVFKNKNLENDITCLIETNKRLKDDNAKISLHYKSLIEELEFDNKRLKNYENDYDLVLEKIRQRELQNAKLLAELKILKRSGNGNEGSIRTIKENIYKLNSEKIELTKILEFHKNEISNLKTKKNQFDLTEKQYLLKEIDDLKKKLSEKNFQKNTEITKVTNIKNYIPSYQRKSYQTKTYQINPEIKQNSYKNTIIRNPVKRVYKKSCQCKCHNCKKQIKSVYSGNLSKNPNIRYISNQENLTCLTKLSNSLINSQLEKELPKSVYETSRASEENFNFNKKDENKILNRSEKIENGRENAIIKEERNSFNFENENLQNIFEKSERDVFEKHQKEFVGKNQNINNDKNERNVFEIPQRQFVEKHQKINIDKNERNIFEIAHKEYTEKPHREYIEKNEKMNFEKKVVNNLDEKIKEIYAGQQSIKRGPKFRSFGRLNRQRNNSVNKRVYNLDTNVEKIYQDEEMFLQRSLRFDTDRLREKI